MADQLHGKALIEDRFGPLGKGNDTLIINEAEYDLAMMLARMDLAVDDVRVIDAVQLALNHFVLRYYDAQDHTIVAHEFDSTFRFLNETRAHIAEWIGDEAYFDALKAQPFPGVLGRNENL